MAFIVHLFSKLYQTNEIALRAKIAEGSVNFKIFKISLLCCPDRQQITPRTT